WHWTEANGWSFIHRGTCDTANLMGSVGYNAVYATRPTLAESPARNELVCVWEQFDSMNIEPATGLMRADIYAALSLDGGVHWNQAVRITDPDQTSKRFPCVAAAFDDDTVLVIYEIDQVAGFALYSQGPVTQNPVIVQRVWKGDLSGTAETPVAFPTRYDINATPNPFRTGTRISYALPKSGNVRLGVYDAAGKLVARLADGVQSAGTHYADWTPTGAQPGVYFYTLVAGNTKLTKKLTLLQ
ncbi:MAG: T9SS type A sorting domain-containing protein, partial [candidate division WOR-3 bacterium]